MTQMTLAAAILAIRNRPQAALVIATDARDEARERWEWWMNETDRLETRVDWLIGLGGETMRRDLPRVRYDWWRTEAIEEKAMLRYMRLQRIVEALQRRVRMRTSAGWWKAA